MQVFFTGHTYRLAGLIAGTKKIGPAAEAAGPNLCQPFRRTEPRAQAENAAKRSKPSTYITP
jgi:hypothetical protein